MGSLAEFCQSDINGNSTTYARPSKRSKNNIFKWMSLFFRENALSVKANFSILMSMLEDFQLRKGYTFSTLLGQLRDFCSNYESDNSRFFIKALLDINRKQGSIFENAYVRELVFLLWDEVGNFSDLLGNVCGKSSEMDILNLESAEIRCMKHQKSVEDLRYILKHASPCTFQIRSFVADGKEEINQVRLIDYPLNYGESALMSAARHRKPDVILTLLRHGANVESNWMCYKSALEVLLLAPNLIYLSAKDLQNIEFSMLYFTRACIRINKSRIDTLIEEGYSPLHEKWQQLIPASRTSQPCSLMHKCRTSIREALNTNCRLPDGIELLPLPQILKEYLDLQRD